MFRRLRASLLVVHRWLALALAPVFLLVLVSAAVLAFRPISEDLRPDVRLDPHALVQLLDRVDPGGAAQSITLSGDRKVVTLAPAGTAYDIATGTQVEPPLDLFGFAQRMHTGLLVGATFLAVIAAIAMSLVVLGGLLLRRPRFGETLIGWHAAIGWILIPLVLLTPLTGALVGLKIGGPQLPQFRPPDQPIPIARGIERAAEQGIDLSRLAQARSFRHGSVRLTTRGGPDHVAYYVAGPDGVLPAPGAPGFVRRIHEGIWAGGASGVINLVSVLALLGLLGTGVVAWARRWSVGRRRTGDENADVLVAYASQTGTAARLAEATAASLREGGSRVATASLATLEPVDLQLAHQVLLIVSTTGEGDPPEQARPLLRKLRDASLPGTSFALLALGDRRYGAANFAAGGRKVRDALRAAGAREAVPLATADGDPRQAWRTWLAGTSAALHLGAGRVHVPEADAPVTLTLRERTQLNDPRFPETSEVWALTFESAEPLDFRAGDLLMVPPPDGGPERPYSIGSAAARDPRRILLTVALTHVRAANGVERLGQASGLLCRTLREGDRLRASLRRHPGFNLPDDAARPVILVAGGCGIAPFVGFLEEREASAAAGKRIGPAWLLFGNRRAAGDFFHHERLEAWRERGILTRLDTAFSRDPGDGGYATDRMREAAAELVDWMVERGAVLYVCGRATTLGQGVDAALREILVAQNVAGSADEAAHVIAAWEAEGRLHRDLFD